jgi:hypothetical protein
MPPGLERTLTQKTGSVEQEELRNIEHWRKNRKAEYMTITRI